MDCFHSRPVKKCTAFEITSQLGLIVRQQQGIIAYTHQTATKYSTVSCTENLYKQFSDTRFILKHDASFLTIREKWITVIESFSADTVGRAWNKDRHLLLSSF